MPARRQANGNTESVDNYLKAIFYLGGPGESRVTIKSLSERLCVAPASVTNMLQNMSGIAEYCYRVQGSGVRWKWCVIIG